MPCGQNGFSPPLAALSIYACRQATGCELFTPAAAAAAVKSGRSRFPAEYESKPARYVGANIADLDVYGFHLHWVLVICHALVSE